jgi:hypothetical protein
MNELVPLPIWVVTSLLGGLVVAVGWIVRHLERDCEKNRDRDEATINEMLHRLNKLERR